MKNRCLSPFPLGVKGTEQLFGRNQNITLRKISGIFQRLYRGTFSKNENLLIPKSFLVKLKRAGLKLGIVTGRNQDEANQALVRFGIDRLIDGIVTADETPGKFKKPHPYGLLKIANQLGVRLRYLYVGDLVDDMLAAKAARKKIEVSSCAYLAAASSPHQMRRSLKTAGADYLCSTVRGLARIIGV